MNKWIFVLLFGVCLLLCSCLEPFMPREGTLPFLVYYPSRYRGLCSGTLVSRTAVLTAAVCVTSPLATWVDDRFINVVVGTPYRHPRRGIRVQVTKILIPNLHNVTGNKGYLMQKSAAVLILKRKIPDILTEKPLRPIKIDWKGEELLSLQEECIVAGWHFFYKNDVIYPVHKFLLQRNLRAQFVHIVKKNTYCEALSVKFTKALRTMGFNGLIDHKAMLCIRDSDRQAQACHGMYGTPLICRGRVVAVMMAPDAQWTNCTGHSNIMHILSSAYLRPFMTCVSRLFDEEDAEPENWAEMKKSITNEYTENSFDYVPELYDLMYGDSDSSSDEL